MSKRTLLFVLWAVMVVLFLGSAVNYQLAAYEAKDLERLLTTNRCPGGDLSQADLSGKNLERANLHKANLQGANLTGANLQKANLSGVNLSQANLTGANLKNAKLEHANLKGAHGNEAVLYHANLKFADLRHATLVNADLRKANLSFANFLEADLTGAKLEGAITKRTIFPGVTPTPTSRLRSTSRPTSTQAPTPTPTPTDTPTPEPTSRPTTTPRATPTPSPTVTPTVTANPTQRMLTATPTRRIFGTPTSTPTPVPEHYGVFYITQADTGTEATISLTIVNNTSVTVNGWSLTWTFPGDQSITSLSGGMYTQTGADVTVTDGGVNPVIWVNYSVNISFSFTYTGTNSVPAVFLLNGTDCIVATATPTNTPTLRPTSTRRIYITPSQRPTPTPSPRPTPLPTPTMGAGQGMVSGCVTDVWTFRSISGAQVEAYNGPDFSNLVTTTTSDHVGLFTLSLDPGEYLLMVKMGGYLTIQVHTKITQGEITYESQLGAIPSAFQGDGTVSMVITDAETCQYVSGVNINFREGVNTVTGPVAPCTRPDYNANLFILPAGNYTAEIQAPGYITGYLNVVSMGGKTTLQPKFSLSPVVSPDQLRIVLNWDIRFPVTPTLYLKGYDQNQNLIDSNANPELFQVNQSYSDGVISATVMNKSQVKSMNCAVWDSRNGYKTNSSALITSWATIRVYQGADLTDVFHVPMVQNGNLWTVFYWDQNGSHPINLLRDESDPGNSFSHDVNGDQILDWVVKETNQLTVFHVDGSKNTYPISAPNWQIYDYRDMDGEPGEEILVMVINPASGFLNRLMIIHDRTQSVNEVANFGDSPLNVYFEELDGAPGWELVLEKYLAEPDQHIFRVVSDRSGISRDYDFSGFTPAYYLSDLGNCDVNGKPGNELLLTRNDNEGHLQFAVINYLDNQVNYYSVPVEDDYFPLLGEMNGEPGWEIWLIPNGTNATSGIHIIHDRDQTVSTYPGIENAISMGIYNINLDGAPGDELVCDFMSETPYQRVLRVISDRDGSFRDYDCVDYGPDFSYYFCERDLNGRPGLDLVFTGTSSAGARIGVLSYRDGLLNNYTIPFNSYWGLVDFLDTDGLEGAEIIIETDGPPGTDDKQITIIHDRNGQINQFSGFGPSSDCFYLVTVMDLGGQPGMELVFEKYSYEPYDYAIRILSEGLNGYRDYHFSNLYQYSYLDFSSSVDLDGQPGNELVFCGYNDNGYEYNIINFSNNQAHSYLIEPEWSWYGVYDYNGQPGLEIVFYNPSTGAYKAICDAQGIILQ